MSRIGIKPIQIPAGVEVTVDENNNVTVKGPKGELHQSINEDLKITVEDGVVTVSRPDDGRILRSQHGLARTLINNMIEGVEKGFEKKLLISGVGYTASKQGSKLVLKLGYSHPIEMEDPEGITTETPDANTIVVKGADKAQEPGENLSHTRARALCTMVKLSTRRKARAAHPLRKGGFETWQH